MYHFSYSEYTDMLLILGECCGNSQKAVRRYREKFPNRHCPNRRTILAVERRCRETGLMKPKKTNSGRIRTARTVRKEEDVLQILYNNPAVSTRRIALQTNISQSVAWRIAKGQQLYPYHLRQVQEHLPEDSGMRLEFSEWLIEQHNINPNFLSNIIFTDEATFTRNGMFNMHNSHVWAEQNPKATRVTHYQHGFKINVWAATLNNRIIGFHFFPGNLNANSYCEFLRNTFYEFVEDIPLQLRETLWFMHDGAPPHYGREPRHWLNDHFPNRWIGRGIDAPIHWPPRSPDLNPLDFTIWGQIKEKVYSTPVDTLEDLRNRIEQAFQQSLHQPRIMFSLQKRLRACVQVNGGHFEQLL